MTNSELAEAIDATWRLIQSTTTGSELRAPTVAHYMSLLAEQARRAAERPAAFVPTYWPTYWPIYGATLGSASTDSTITITTTNAPTEANT